MKGISMEPNYCSNDHVFCIKTKKIKVNDVVVLNHKIHGKIIKRVQSINENGLFVSGDNKTYDSSITNECQPIQSIIGRVF